MVSFEAILIFYAINSLSYSNQVAVKIYTLGSCKIMYANRKVEPDEETVYFKEPAFGLLTALLYHIRFSIIDISRYFYDRDTQLR